ncbi:site-specific DNA-methyltransferase [Actinomycetota bacterium]
MTGSRLELLWPGKDKFLLVPKDEAGKPVWVERDHPAASEVRLSDFTGTVGEVPENPHAANLLFTGDSLDVLRILCEVPEYRSIYRGKIRLVYIDPPFNTGQAFEHYDDWMEHSTWLSFMRERLLLIRDLLTPDGSVWVHLDDAEQHRMRCLMDEVFGPANFVANVIWEKADSPRNSARQFSTDQDYVLVYSRDPEWSPNRLPRTTESDSIYTNPDGDPRGPWLPGDPYANKPYSKGLYEKTGPTGRVFAPPPGRYWRVSEEKLDELDAEGRVWWGPTGNARPSIKRYLSEVSDLVPRTIWSKGDVGSNRTSKNEMRALFAGVSSFATPKPERFMERVLRIASTPGDIVLDCFAGSGTTAAVAHKMGRRWVTAELSPSTVEQFTLPRLIKVIDGEDPGGITKSVEWEGGGGFRTVTVGPSMYAATPFGVLLAEWATNGHFARAVAGQLGFEFQPDAAPLCGVRGRMRLAVIDGAVGPEEIRQIVGTLGEEERVTLVAKSVLDGAESTLKEISPGSRIRKAPRDLLTSGAQRMRRRTEASTRHTCTSTEGSQS